MIESYWVMGLFFGKRFPIKENNNKYSNKWIYLDRFDKLLWNPLMKIKSLFERLEAVIAKKENIKEIFQDSGMMLPDGDGVHYGLLDYGFFPFGSGLLIDDIQRENAEIQEGGIMVLGNDFGTIDYLKNNCPGNNEKSTSPTIRNLVAQDFLKPYLSSTFFTNLYLGIRSSGVSMTGKINLKKEYKEFCYTFFFDQLELINPRVIICLGKSVGNAVSNILGTSVINKEKKGDIFIIETNVRKVGARKFILIPHPSFAHINWKNGIREDVLKEISND